MGKIYGYISFMFVLFVRKYPQIWKGYSGTLSVYFGIDIEF